MTLHTSRFALKIALLFTLISCENTIQSDAVPNQSMGRVAVSLHPEITVKTATVISDVDEYNFRYVGVNGYATSEYYRYGSVSWPMDWYLGIFRLEAESCTEAQAEEGYGRIRYAGIGDPFSVIVGNVATTSVSCVIANYMVSVKFDDSMFESFNSMKFEVRSFVLPPVEEEGEQREVNVDYGVVQRTLEFDPITSVGYYNVHLEPMYLYYVLSGKLDGAEEYVEMLTGYYTDPLTSEPAVVNAGDAISFNVKYVGDPIVSQGIKFIVSGVKSAIDDNITLEDYTQGSVVEDN